MSDLQAHEVPLSKVFSSDYDFQIPDYQRPYSWGVEQASELLEDLGEALDRNDNEPYFLGSIVLVKEKSSPRAEVIDGQQRLTTLTLLLAIFRDLTTDPDLAADFGGMILEPGKKLLNLQAKPRLRLRSRDAEFFQERVQTAGSVPVLLGLKPDALKSDPQRNVRSNAHALWEVLSSWTEERRFQLSALLLNRTYLVVVSTPDLSSAHRIFSVMNARGLDLSPADIFKAQIIGSMPPSQADAYAVKWEGAEESLGRQDFADLFLHVRMIFARVRAAKELLKEFPEQVLNSYLPTRAARFVDDVVLPYADAFQVVRGKNYSAQNGAEKVNAWLRRLSMTDNNDWVPVALWALHYKGDDPVWLDSFLAKLERVAANMLIRRVYSTPRATRYANILRNLESGADLNSDSLELTREEKSEALTALDGPIYHQPAVRKYVLLRLDEMVSGATGVIFDHKIITVEHVLPQNPKVGAKWMSDFDQAERDHWTNRLANLVLLNRRKNSEAQNFDFSEKKDKYFSSDKGVPTFGLTVQVIHDHQWNPETLELRQANLLGKLAAEWDL